MEMIYFIKHKGISPIKIGRTSDLKSRISRFNNASPYGIEIIGVIETEKSQEFERILHKKFSSFRLNGEWFSITEQQALDFINLHKDRDYIQSKNDFETEHYRIITPLNIVKDLSLHFSMNQTDDLKHKVVLNHGEISKLFDVNNVDVKSYLESKYFNYKSNRLATGVVKSGVRIYIGDCAFTKLKEITDKY